MIKMPAADAGLGAITAATAEGISVTVTLVSGLKRYAAVIDACLAGLERAATAGINPITIRPGHESLGRRLAREEREPTGEPEGDGLGDSIGTDGELIDDQVGDQRAGRLVLGAIDELDPSSDYVATDAGIDGGGTSAEEVAVHVVPDSLPFNE